MVRDGIYYAAGMIAAAVVIGWLTSPPWSLVPLAFAAFFLWFFRDPERVVPAVEGAVVSPADGRVTDVSPLAGRTRVSIFLSVFNVHVNRSPISGLIRNVEYRKGSFRNAMSPACADSNEQNIITVDDGCQTVIFKQIAGLLARRIVFTKRAGDPVRRGERVGMIKFGSRVDVLLPAAAALRVKTGDRVRGGSSILAVLPVPSQEELVANKTTGSRSARS